MKSYIIDSIRVTAIISFALLTVAALSALVVAFAVPFFVLFPLVLMTKPAITRAAKAANEALTAWLESKVKEKKAANQSPNERNANGDETFL